MKHGLHWQRKHKRQQRQKYKTNKCSEVCNKINYDQGSNCELRLENPRSNLMLCFLDYVVSENQAKTKCSASSMSFKIDYFYRLWTREYMKIHTPVSIDLTTITLDFDYQYTGNGNDPMGSKQLL